MARRFLAAIACLFIARAASAADVPVDKINAMKGGVTTKAQVYASLGKPIATNQNPDGRSTAVYDYTVPVSEKNKTAFEMAVVFLFDPRDVMVDAKFYAKKPPGAEGAPPAAAPPPAGLQDENLLTPLEDGFKIASRRRNGQLGGSEMVPQGETVQVWTRMVTSQTYYGRSHADPDAIPGGMAKSWPQACPGGSSQRLEAGTENGYPTSLWAFRCPLNPQTGKPENMWMKVISGADALYDVQYAYRRAYADDMAAQAQAFLKRVKVCDTRNPERHPCPDLKPAAR